MGEFFTGIGSIWNATGVGRTNAFRVWLHELKGERGFQYPYGFGPVTLNEGLMKPRRGFTPAAEKKIWEWAPIKALNSC